MIYENSENPVSNHGLKIIFTLVKAKHEYMVFLEKASGLSQLGEWSRWLGKVHQYTLLGSAAGTILAQSLRVTHM